MNDHFNSVQFAASLSGLGPLHLYAGRNTVASRFRCQPCGCGYIVRGLDGESAEQAYAAIRRWMNVRGVSPRRGKTRTQPWPNDRNPISGGAELVQSRVARLRLEQLLDQASCLMVRLQLQALRAAPEDVILFKPAPAFWIRHLCC